MFWYWLLVQTSMSSGAYFFLLLALYTLFSVVLSNMFHTPIVFFIAGIAAALVGLGISMLVGEKKS
jgi:hypothetical protein